MKNILKVTALALAASLTGQVQAATSTHGFADFPAQINNTWFNFRGALLQIQTPYRDATPVAGGNNEILLSPLINGFNAPDHLHKAFVRGSVAVNTHGDTGGIYLNVVNRNGIDLKPFTFNSFDLLEAEFDMSKVGNLGYAPTFTIKGYLGGVNGMNDGGQSTGGRFAYVGGSHVATAVLTNASLGAVDLLAIDPNFFNVDHVEFFFTDFYRRIPLTIYSNQNLNFTFDNVRISTVPVPAAAYLFATGLIGLVSFGRKRAAQLAS